MAKYSYLFEVPSISYAENLVSISKTVFAHSHQTCYITLNKTAGMVKNMLQDGGVFTASYSFIDGISAALFTPISTKDTYYLKYPIQLHELETTIWTMIRAQRADSIIFDSLSTFTTYPNQEDIIRFFHKLIAQLAEQHIIVVFVCLLEDTQKPLVAHVAMSVDEVQEVREK